MTGRRGWVGLALVGIGLAVVAGLAVLRLRQPSPAALLEPSTTCAIASVPERWYELAVALLHDTREPCASFYWMPEPSDEFHQLVTFNNFGLHAPLYNLQKAPDVFRLLIVGDSFPQGMQVAMEQTFPYLLQQQLNRDARRPVEVINLSVDAYGTDRELLLYALLGGQFQPDAVLLSFYTGNDVQDNEIDLEARRYGYRLERPFFTLEGETLQLHNSPTFAAGLFDDVPYHWLAQMQAAQFAVPPDDPPEHPTVLNPAPDYQLEYPVELGLYLPEEAHWAKAWALSEALITQFQQVVQQQGIPFGVVILPDRRAVHGEDWSATLVKYGEALPALRQSDPTAPGTRLNNFLTERAIPVLNLTWTLRAWVQSHPGERLYYAGDGHFNAQGQAVTAERLAGWVKVAGLAPE